MSSMVSSLVEEARTHFADMVRIRRRMHRHPEVGLDLPITRRIILEELDDLPIRVIEHEKTTGVVAVLEGGDPSGPVTLLRADHDGLPMTESTGLDFSSETGNTMHACGHDLHTAMLLSATRMLVDHRSELSGPVVFMFQPGEEGHHGARFMIDEGALEAAGRRADRAFALHVFSQLDSGTVAFRPGPVMAGSDEFHITMIGAGGHASAPHLALDPVPAAAEMVLAMQSAVTRRMSVFDPAVVTFAHLEAGSATNVIPERVHAHGTMRTFSSGTREAIRALLEQVAVGVASAHGLQAEVAIAPGYPVTVNDPSETERLRSIITAMGVPISELPNPMMASEDWSFVLEEVRGAMFMLGARPERFSADATPMNHSDVVDFDERAMPTGAAVYAAAALDMPGSD
jgi:amidohydrolase